MKPEDLERLRLTAWNAAQLAHEMLGLYISEFPEGEPPPRDGHAAIECRDFLESYQHQFSPRGEAKP